VRIYSHTGKRN